MGIRVLLLTCLLVLVECGIEHVNRINYGAVFKHIGYYDNSGLSWLHVFSIPFRFRPSPQLHTNKEEVAAMLQNLNLTFMRNWQDAIFSLQEVLPSPGQAGLPSPAQAGRHGRVSVSQEGDVGMHRRMAAMDRLSEGERSRLLNLTRSGNASMATSQMLTPLEAGTGGGRVSAPPGLTHALSHMLYMADTVLQGAGAKIAIDGVVSGLHALVRGRLTPGIVSYDVMQDALALVSRRLARQLPAFRLAHAQADVYYKHSQAVAFWEPASATLSVAVRLPLTSDSSRLRLYRVDTYPIVVRQDSHNVTQLVGVPRYLAVRQGASQALELSSEDLSRCSEAAQLWSCSVSMPLTSASRPSCLLSVFREDAFAVRTSCTYEVVRNGLQPGVREVLPSLMLLSRVERHVLQCRGTSSMHAGCTQCLVRVPCRCTLLARGFETAQRLHACPDHLSSAEAVVPLLTSNLGFLTKVLPEAHALLKSINQNGSASVVSDELVPDLLLGTLLVLTSSMGHPATDAHRAIVATGEVDVASGFAAQWERAMQDNVQVYDNERYTTAGVFVLLLVFFAITCCIFSYQRRHLEVRLVSLELDHVDCELLEVDGQ